ncbi:hypothetical protein Pisl_1086 [Pyrobaculum islandicum DSM 4184]|uniref:Uncharacterized protein n=1 Tax=Pyrobaculum islandicum (strain DSM 4184 / JCM 9189 / GEO3) TaxID=384616 RepID=A1RTH6_PYRIL|nr:hypothetical protein Pisl_1086 [Pyrobaculum islandicum DSM 4184]
MENERDMSRAVFVNLKSGVVRVRKLGIPPFVLKLKKGSISWIRERLQEGAKLKLTFLGIEKRDGEKDPTYGGLYIALVSAREVKPTEPKALVVVDVNRLDHYIKVGLVADGRRGRQAVTKQATRGRPPYDPPPCPGAPEAAPKSLGEGPRER